jgi:thioredoxin-like negative regulator of GroEL
MRIASTLAAAGSRPSRTVRLHLVCLVGVVALALPAGAQEIQWRTDYNLARKEALEKGLPLFLDFGTENCFWCKKLESTTFREPVIQGLLNHKFIALRVDANREPNLTELLRIRSFPTLVLAGPDGKILGTLEGFMEGARLQDHLQRILASISNPEWMTRDYDEAARAIAASDYARAVALLKSITEDGKDRPVQLKSRQVLADLEQQAAGRLLHAKELDDRGQTNDAMAALSDLLRMYAGTQAAVDGSRLLTSLAAKPDVKAGVRARRAQELLAQAREDYRNQQYLCCLDRCENLTANYSDLSEGGEALQLAAEIKNNPEWLQNACNSLTDRLGGMYLALADSWLRKGQPRQAALCLERLIQTLPNTRQAESAQMRLAAIQGRSTFQADFKK